MTVPTWIDSAVSAFGQSAGLGSLSLGDRGVAALSFRASAGPPRRPAACRLPCEGGPCRVRRSACRP